MQIAYVGATRPRRALGAPGPPATDFLPVSCPASDVPNWGQCEYITEVTADSAGTIWAALGVWQDYEVHNTFYVDKVTVTIDPLPGQTTTMVLGMVPDSANGELINPLFTLVFSDTKGWQDLGVVNILINDSLNPANACYLAYVPDSNGLFLVNDAGTALLPGTKFPYRYPWPTLSAACY